jgi:aminopeptidase YwaD
MILLSTALLLAAAIDGQAALGHASKLSALGPHKWGSPLNGAAADYVAAQFGEAGLQEVRQQAFSSQGLHGSNVIGVLPAPGPEFVLVGAHHDTAPEAPGAYDDGGGVGVLIEVARVLAKNATRPRTLVFVSFDGEEAWASGKGTITTTGSRAYIEKLGSRSRDLVAALVVEMCGWSGGTPVLHPIPYADSLQPGRYGVTPAWLMRAALQGASDAGAPLGVGDPLIPWLYQPGVRMFRAGLYGDDLSFVQARLPAVFVSDSSFSAFYPWYHQPSDTKDKLSAEALERMGASVLGALSALGSVPRTDALDPQWFVAFGRVLGEPWLWLLAALAVLPGLVLARRAGSVLIGVRLLQALLFAVLVWRHPVPALVVLVLPTLLAAVASRGITLIGLLPALGLGALVLLGYQRGMLRGTWFQPWEFLVLGLALALPFVRPPARVTGRSRSAPKAKRKR